MFSDRFPSELSFNRFAQALRSARTAARPLVDLAESNPTRCRFEYPSELLALLSDPRGLVYDPQPLGMPEARAAVADDYCRRGLSVRPDQVVLTTSTSEAYSLLFKLLAGAGDDVVVPRPSYPLFDHLARFDAVRIGYYDLDYTGTWSIDLDSVERALTPRTRAVLVVSPNNPTGSFVTEDAFDRLMALCAPRGIAIIADEVFADYELTPGAAARAARTAVCRQGLTFSLGGLSKAAGLPQIKLAWIVVGGSSELRDAAIERLELACDTYLSVSTPTQLAAPGLLRAGAAIRSQIQSRVAANYHEALSQSGGDGPCRVLNAEGGWYAVMQVPSLGSEEDMVVSLVEREGVVTHPGYFFDFPRESFVVLSLLPAPEVFAEGMSLVLRHFDAAGAPR
jgi:hypothetical protein